MTSAILPTLLASGAGAAGGQFLHGGSGWRRGAIRGAGAGLGATAGATGASMLASALGAGENTDSIARLIGALGGGYGGYHLARKFTKTPGEDAKDQIDAHQKMANTQPPQDNSEILKYLANGIGGNAIAGAGLGGLGGLLPGNSGILPGAVRGGLAGAGYAGGGLLGDIASEAMHVENPLLRTGINVGSRLLGAHTGYQIGKKLTKTRKEQLDDAMYEWYNNPSVGINPSQQGEKMANAPGAIPKPIAPISTVPGGVGAPTPTPSFTPQPKAPQSPPTPPTGPSNFAAPQVLNDTAARQAELNRVFGGMRPGNPFGDPRPDPRPGAVRTLTPQGSGHAWTTEVPRVSDGYDHIVRGIQARRQATRDNAYADSLTAGQRPTPEGRAAWNKARPVNFEQEMRDVRAEADKAAGPRAETWAPVPTALTPEQTQQMASAHTQALRRNGRFLAGIYDEKGKRVQGRLNEDGTLAHPRTEISGNHAFNGRIMPDGSLGYATPSDEQVAALNAQQQMRQHQQAQATLVQQYPELGQAGTPQNKAFVDIYKAHQATGTPSPDMNAIAQEVYAPAKTPGSVSAEDPMMESNAQSIPAPAPGRAAWIAQTNPSVTDSYLQTVLAGSPTTATPETPASSAAKTPAADKVEAGAGSDNLGGGSPPPFGLAKEPTVEELKARWNPKLSPEDEALQAAGVLPEALLTVQKEGYDHGWNDQKQMGANQAQLADVTRNFSRIKDLQQKAIGEKDYSLAGQAASALKRLAQQQKRLTEHNNKLQAQLDVNPFAPKGDDAMTMRRVINHAAGGPDANYEGAGYNRNWIKSMLPQQLHERWYD